MTELQGVKLIETKEQLLFMGSKYANLNSELNIGNYSAATSMQVSENCQILVRLHICI